MSFNLLYDRVFTDRRRFKGTIPLGWFEQIRIEEDFRISGVFCCPGHNLDNRRIILESVPAYRGGAVNYWAPVNGEVL